MKRTGEELRSARRFKGIGLGSFIPDELHDVVCCAPSGALRAGKVLCASLEGEVVSRAVDLKKECADNGELKCSSARARMELKFEAAIQKRGIGTLVSSLRYKRHVLIRSCCMYITSMSSYVQEKLLETAA